MSQTIRIDPPASRALIRDPHAARPSRGERPLLELSWARHADEVREAQRLRYQVFAIEMGASLGVPPGTPPAHDADRFDAHCEHLLVRTAESASQPARLIGTYRVMMPAAAARLGGYYTETEFDLAAIGHLRPQMAELGRACVAVEWRAGAVILMMWSKLAEFMLANRIGAMIGCASIPMADGGHGAASLWQRLKGAHLAPEAERVTPRLALPIEALRTDVEIEAPALVKGYLKCGARILGAPAWDPDFNTADLPMLLQLAHLPEQYRRRFLSS